MANAISGLGAPDVSAATVVSSPVSTAVQAKVATVESASIEALFGSLGLGSKVNATA